MLRAASLLPHAAAPTGFAPFGTHRVNPSQQVVRALAGRPGLAAAVVPVSYRRAEARLRSSKPHSPALAPGQVAVEQLAQAAVPRLRHAVVGPDHAGAVRPCAALVEAALLGRADRIEPPLPQKLRGSPRPRLAMMFFWISLVPPPMVSTTV